MIVKRREVYRVINGERAYQDSLGPDRRLDKGPRKIGEYLTLLREYLDKATGKWVDLAGDVAALHEVRKVAALAVACLEENGCPGREGWGARGGADYEDHYRTAVDQLRACYQVATQAKYAALGTADPRWSASFEAILALRRELDALRAAPVRAYPLEAERTVEVDIGCSLSVRLWLQADASVPTPYLRDLHNQEWVKTAVTTMSIAERIAKDLQASGIQAVQVSRADLLYGLRVGSVVYCVEW